MTNKLKKFIVPVFIPHQGCPFSCIFCNQKNITGVQEKDVKKQIETFLSYKKDKNRDTEIAFYGGTFLGLHPTKIVNLLEIAEEFIKKNEASAIRFSTRPDSVNDTTLNLIKDFSVRTIELGVQSMDDRVLKVSQRGHTSSDTKKAFELIKERGFLTGAQIMIGLPEDSTDTILETANKLIKLAPNFLRIYPCVVLKNTILADMYQAGSYKPFSLKKSVEISKKLYLLFKENSIKVIRMGLQSTSSLEKEGNILAGPYHPSFAHLVFSSVFLDKAIELLKDKKDKEVVFEVNPKSVSVARGINNYNIKSLMKKFKLLSVDIKPSSYLSIDDLKLTK